MLWRLVAQMNLSKNPDGFAGPRIQEVIVGLNQVRELHEADLFELHEWP